MKQAEYITRANRIIRAASAELAKNQTPAIHAILTVARSTAMYILCKSDTEPVSLLMSASKIVGKNQG